VAVDIPIVTCFTPSYYEHANALREDCNRLGVPFIGIPYIDQGDWFANCRMKPSLLLGSGIARPFIFTDADSRLRREPDTAFLADADIATPPHTGDIGRDLYGGTIYFGGTVEAMAFVACWVDTVNQYDDKTEEWALTHTYRFVKDRIVYRELPPEWAALPSADVSDPIIEIVLSGEARKYNLRKYGGRDKS